MSNETKITVTKLVADGSNWVTYRDRMLWAIDSHGLSEHLTSLTIMQAYQDAGNVGILMPQMWWHLDQAAVKQLVSSSVLDTIFNTIKTGTTAKDVWDVLKKLFEGCTTLILVDLGRHLQMTRCTKEDSIREHFEQLTDLHQQLVAMDKTAPDSKYASILMGSLPPLYQPTLSAISVAAEMSSTTPTPAIVTKLTTDEYDQRTLRGGKAQDEAFATVADACQRGKKQVECFNCHKKGHVKADCWVKGGGKEGQGLRRRGGGARDRGTKGDAATGAEQAGVVICRLGLGLKAPAWAWLERAQAS